VIPTILLQCDVNLSLLLEIGEGWLNNVNTELTLKVHMEGNVRWRVETC